MALYVLDDYWQEGYVFGMALIIEDGTVVPGATSYVTAAEVQDFANARGIAIPTNDVDVEILIHQAMDWFESQTFVGTRVDCDQPLSFPRNGVCIDGCPVASDTIPALVKNVVIQASIDANSVTLQPTYAGSDGGGVKREKVDVLEQEFFGPNEGYSRNPFLGKVSAMIQPLLGGGLGIGRIMSYRT